VFERRSLYNVQFVQRIWFGNILEGMVEGAHTARGSLPRGTISGNLWLSVYILYSIQVYTLLPLNERAVENFSLP
jgi:hypothetical protein